MKYFLWYVIGGLLYSMLVMSILNMGLPAEIGGKPIPEWTQVSYNILIAGWDNFTVITAVSVLAFGIFPRAKASVEKNTEFGALPSVLAIMLTVAPAMVLADVLAIVMADEPTTVVLAFLLASVLGSVLVVEVLFALNVLLLATRDIIKRIHNVHLALTKDN